MSGPNKLSAWLQAEMLMRKYILDSVKIPAVCKNIMVQQISFEMTALRNAIGSIELAARRADAFGVENKIKTKGDKTSAKDHK